MLSMQGELFTLQGHSEGLDALNASSEGFRRREGAGRHGGDIPASVGGDTACHSVIVPRSTPKKKKGLRVKVWKGANLIEIERVTSNKYELDKDEEEDKPKEKRGKVTGCTHGAMRRMRKDMAKVESTQEAYSSCLTYPQQFIELCPHAKGAKIHWQELQRWISNHFPWLGAYWKREPHKSGITHFHLLYFLQDRTEEELRDAVSQILFEWCMITTGEGTSFPAEEHKKQLIWHLHDNNFEKVKKGMSFFNYLGKYISKGSGDVPDGYNNEEGGNWWGRVNKKSIPYVVPVEKTVRLGNKDEARVERAFRKLIVQRRQDALDSLHPVFSDPRFGRDLLARAMWEKRGEGSFKFRDFEKMATRLTFRMEGSRRSVKAPIKSKPRWTKGSMSFMGNPEPLTNYIKKILAPQMDKKGRSRIFGDNYKPLEKNNC